VFAMAKEITNFWLNNTRFHALLKKHQGLQRINKTLEKPCETR